MVTLIRTFDVTGSATFIGSYVNILNVLGDIRVFFFFTQLFHHYIIFLLFIEKLTFFCAFKVLWILFISVFVIQVVSTTFKTPKTIASKKKKKNCN